MAERGISESQILSVLRGNSEVAPGKHGASMIQGIIDGRSLMVVVGTGTENVITAYWTKARRSK
jgi:hypothetical protein